MFNGIMQMKVITLNVKESCAWAVMKVGELGALVIPVNDNP